MKLQYYLLVFAIVLFNFSSPAQTITQVTGTWTFDYNTSVANMEVTSKAHFDSMSTTRKSRLETAYVGRTLTLNPGGSFTLQKSNGSSFTGTWTLSNEQLVLTNTQGKTKTLNIESVTSSSLVLKHVSSGNAKIMMSTWYFTKN